MKNLSFISGLAFAFSLAFVHVFASDSQRFYYSCDGVTDFGNWQQKHYFDFLIEIKSDRITDWQVIGEAPLSLQIAAQNSHPNGVSGKKLFCGKVAIGQNQDSNCQFDLNAGQITLYQNKKIISVISKKSNVSFLSGFDYFSAMPEAYDKISVNNHGNCVRRN